MGKIFTLDADIKGVIQDALDDLITELGKDCLLVYPPKMSRCPNCIFDPKLNKSTNRYNGTGPYFFDKGICPYCNGLGKMESSVNEPIKMLCRWEPKKFFYPIQNLDIRKPYSILQTKFYLKDLPKVNKADSLIFQLPIEPYTVMTYTLLNAPGDQSNIIQGRYAVATWERIT